MQGGKKTKTVMTFYTILKGKNCNQVNRKRNRNKSQYKSSV